MVPENWRELAITEAKTWESTPYVPKARVKGVGVDCGGLLYEVYNPLFGPFPPMPNDYSADWCVHEYNERYLDFIMPFVHEVPSVKPGGFSLFHQGLNYAHAAIMLDNGRYIHAWGRLRQGRVTQSPVRVMMAMPGQNKFKPRHFEPNL